MCEGVRGCMCVHVYMYVHMCVCVCVWDVWEENGWGGGRGTI